MNYLFDVDGTLTPSRLKIDPGFEKFFLDWMKNKNVYLVTGSDKDKTIEQVGEKIWTNVTRAYQSCGNAVYENGKLIEQKDFFLNLELKKLLLEFVKWSDCPRQFDNHIEERIGLVNFSSIGRNCPQEARDEYYDWDCRNKERNTFCNIIEERFPELEATVGGQISIDIYPIGQNKSQVLSDVIGPITFFGDKCKPGGNDYPIVNQLSILNEENNLSVSIHEVSNWKDTLEILNRYK